MRSSYYMVIAFTSLLVSGCSPGIVESPDGGVKASIYVDENEQLRYEVSFQNRVLINRSKLGILVNGISFGEQVSKLDVVESGEVDEIRSYNSHIEDSENTYRYADFEVASQQGRFVLQTRVYDDAFAFRYMVNDSAWHHVQKELTSWHVSDHPDVWFFERESHWKLKSYAGIWTKTSLDSLATISKMGPVQGKPLIMQWPSQYAMITEAALANYSGMRLRATDSCELHVDFTEDDGFEVQGKLVTPWRVIVFSEDLNGLVNSNTIPNLNPLPADEHFADMDWVKPGRSVWSWWSRDSTYMSEANEQAFIDAAHDLEFEYALIDDGWETWPDKWQQLQALIRYATDRGVGLWVWKDSKQIKALPEMQSFLDSASWAGAVGVKVDFMNSEAKEWIDFELTLLKEAALRKLMVNFHGCHASTGEYITYPNELTREGIRGIELNIMGKPLPASHNAALPFTRLLTGPGDYTPLAFSQPGNTTWAHQLATAFTMDSYFMCMAEDPQMILNEPGLRSVVALLKNLPVVWDETVVLPQSEIGALVLLARKSTGVTYLIAINGESNTQNIEVNLSDLNRDYDSAAYWLDGQGQEITFQKESVNNGLIEFELKKNGGAVIKLFN